MSKFDFAKVQPADVAKMNSDDVKAYVAWLQEQKSEAEAKVAALQSESAQTISFKVGPRGGLSVYGLGQYPLNAYKEQWLRLLAGNKGAEDGSTFARLITALANPDLSAGKDDPRYSGDNLKARLAKAEADRAAKTANRANGKGQDTTQDMRPRLAPVPANS